MTYNDLVVWFSEHMFDKLEENFHKKDTYKDLSFVWLLEKLNEEIHEVFDALAADLPYDVVKECADAANVLMFIAHNANKGADPKPSKTVLVFEGEEHELK